MTDNISEILTDLAAAVQEESGESSRVKRKKTKGLPELPARRMLAETYLKNQHILWPELVKSGLLPKISEDSISAMAEEFHKKFVTGQWTPFTHWLAPPTAVAAIYLRFSDEGSNPRSLDQQFELTLKKARSLGYFVPWQYAFADSVITG